MAKEALGGQGGNDDRRRSLIPAQPRSDHRRQIVRLKAAGADLLYDASTPKFAAQAIKKSPISAWNWSTSSISTRARCRPCLSPAGLDISKDIVSTNYGKDPGDPQWKDDPGIKAYFAFMDKYYPEGDKLNTVNTYGYSTAELLVHRSVAMRRRSHARKYHEAGGESEEPVISATLVDGVDQHLADRLPHQQADADDEVQRARSAWELFGPIIEDTGPSCATNCPNSNTSRPLSS